MKKVLALLFLMMFVFCSSSFSDEKFIQKKKQERAVLAQNLLYKVFTAFGNYQEEGFDELVDPNFPMRFEFLKNLETSGQYGDTNFTVNDADYREDLFVVNFSWARHSYNPTQNQPPVIQGQSEFVFRKINGRWLIYQINQDNPFVW